MPGRLIRRPTWQPPAARCCLPNSTNSDTDIDYFEHARAPLWLSRLTSEPTASGPTTSSSSVLGTAASVWSAVVSSLLRPCYQRMNSAQGKGFAVSLSPMPKRQDHGSSEHLAVLQLLWTRPAQDPPGAGRSPSPPAGSSARRGRSGASSSSSSTALPRSGATAAGATLGPEQYFGELALLDRRPRSATVVSDTDMRLLVLEQRAFNGILEDVRPSPQAARRHGNEAARSGRPRLQLENRNRARRSQTT